MGTQSQETEGRKPQQGASTVTVPRTQQSGSSSASSPPSAGQGKDSPNQTRHTATSAEARSTDKASSGETPSASPQVSGASSPSTGQALYLGSSLGRIALALSRAQGEFPEIDKNRTVLIKSDKGQYEFSYATLDEIRSKTQPALTKYGLAVAQTMDRNGTGWALRTRLIHESGEFIESFLPIAPDPGYPQKVGSAITYFRRYELSAILGVAAEEDDDGNVAAGNHMQSAPRKPSPQPVGNANANKSCVPVTEAQVKRLYAIANSHGWAHEQVKAELLKRGKKSSKDLNMLEYDQFVAFIEGGWQDEQRKDVIL